jgi:ABC-type transport system involved in multi-copper enzyme maturation permease subunit
MSKENTSASISNEHTCETSTSGNVKNKLKLIFAIVKKDLTQIYRNGLPILLVVAVFWCVFGFLFFDFANTKNGGGVQTTGDWNSIPALALYTLLQNVYGYAVLVTMFLVACAFLLSYDKEIKKGTVRTLTCYPLGVFELISSKLIYAAIVGLVFGLPVFISPLGILDKPISDILAVFFVAYLMSLIIVAVGAFGATAIAFLTKRMYLSPSLLATVLIGVSFLTTSSVINELMYAVKWAAGGFQYVRLLTPLSPFHQGRLILTATFGGSFSLSIILIAIPLLLIVLGVILTLKLWPDIYDKE